MIVFDHFFLQNMFFMGMTKEGFFLGYVGHFFGPWERFPEKEGGQIVTISNVMYYQKV